MTDATCIPTGTVTGPCRASMSRLSRANLKARESVFAGGPELYRGDIQAICPPNLEECVMAMEDCCEEVKFHVLMA